MGTVYMAEQTQPVRRTVALKLIKAGMDSRQVLARFGAERQALALMDHPNIAKVFDAGTTDDGRPYFVMELVKGIPITRFCDERRLTTRERLELAIPVCQAVQHAHQKGIIHRDLKPSNVLIALYDGKPVPKVIDFGVAKATGPQLTDQTLYTEFGAVVGTLEYMSPEQAELNQLDIDTRSDIYSLGVLLYELLTGSTPLDRKRLKQAAVLEVLRVIREEESPRPSLRLSTTEELPSIAACRNIEPRKLSGLVRGELDWIVMKALEKDRNRRYETANGLAADLRRYLDDEPVQACPPSAGYRLRKFARRNRAALATSAFVAVALVVGTAVSSWQAIRAMKAEGLAQKRLEAEGAARLQVTQERDRADQLRSRADEQRLEADRLRALADIECGDPGAATLHQPSQPRLPGMPGQRRGNGRSAARLVRPGPARLGVGLLPGPVPPGVVQPRRLRRPRLGRQESLHTACRSTPPSAPTAAASPWPGRTARSASGMSRPGEKSLVLRGHRGPVRCLAFDREGRRIVSGGDDKTVRIWDAATGVELAVLRGHSERVTGVAFSPAGDQLVSAAYNPYVTFDRGNEFKQWDAATGQEIRTLHHKSGWEMVLGGLQPRRPTDRHFHVLGRARFGSGTRPVGTRSRKAAAIGPKGHGVAFSPADGRVAVGNGERAISLWDPDGRRPVQYLRGHSAEIFDVAFSRDGRRLASACNDGTVKLWDADTGREIASFRGHTSNVLSVDFSPDGRRLVSSSGDNTVKVWDVDASSEALPLKSSRVGLPGRLQPRRTSARVRLSRRVFILDAATGRVVREIITPSPWGASPAWPSTPTASGW